MFVMMLGTAVAFTSCSDDGDELKPGSTKHLDGTAWIAEENRDYIEFRGKTLYWGSAIPADERWDGPSWRPLTGKSSWYCYTDRSFSYIVLNSNTIESFNGQLLEYNGSTIRRGGIIYRKCK